MPSGCLLDEKNNKKLAKYILSLQKPCLRVTKNSKKCQENLKEKKLKR